MTDISSQKHAPDRALFLIHVLTAMGAPIALAALLAGAGGEWASMFAWLGLALIVDGVDGPLARRFKIAQKLPRWSGASLDFVIDYATYVFLPAFALSASGMLAQPWNWICGGLVVFTGALYFADNGMKTPDGSFKGFPAGWNMVVFGLMALSPSQTLTIVFVLACCILTFLPVRFIHPVRVQRWRKVTLCMTGLWFACAALAIIEDMQLHGTISLILGLCCVYLFFVGMVQQLLDRYF